MGESIFFFFYMSAQEGGEKIQTSDFRFIKHGPNRLNYLLEQKSIFFL
jgi:hypothetical protein